MSDRTPRRVSADDQKFFFIHVMKTAGWTLRKHMMANFEEDEFFPTRVSRPTC